MRIGLLIVLMLTACTSSGEATPSEARPGNPAVYERIAASDDCAELQREFDTADANGKRHREAGQLEQAKASTAYMGAADERMKEIDCY